MIPLFRINYFFMLAARKGKKMLSGFHRKSVFTQTPIKNASAQIRICVFTQGNLLIRENTRMRISASVP